MYYRCISNNWLLRFSGTLVYHCNFASFENSVTWMPHYCTGIFMCCIIIIKILLWNTYPSYSITKFGLHAISLPFRNILDKTSIELFCTKSRSCKILLGFMWNYFSPNFIMTYCSIVSEPYALFSIVKGQIMLLKCVSIIHWHLSIRSKNFKNLLYNKMVQ